MVSAGYIIAPLFFILVLSSCNPTKYVPANQTLLDKNEIKINKEEIKKSQLTPYIKQQPNKRIFGTRFYLWLYNLSNINKTRWPHGWLRKIGEPPVIFDAAEAKASTSQLKSFVSSKGFFDSSVTDSIKTADRRTTVFYNIRLIAPYKIRNIYFEITDTNIRKLFYVDSVNCLIKRGKPYDVDNLTAERSRFTRYINDRGFYAFSTDFINFRVDSTVGRRQVDIHYVIRNQTTEDNFNRTIYIPHSVYDIKNIYIYPDYDPAAALEQGDAYLNGLDTIFYKGYYFITPNEKPAIRYDLIIQSLYLKPGNPYSFTNSEQTKSHLMSLKVYRLANITYRETDEPEDKMALMRKLNANIMLTLLVPQSYKIELEGTNTSGNLGGAVNLIYQHKNLFHGAELLSAQVRGAYELLSDTSGNLKSIREYGFETSLRIPKFLIPLKKEDFIRKYNPSTNIVAAYNYQALPVFTRTLASSTFGYTWKAGNFQTHIVNPLFLNLIRIPSIDPVFENRIKSTYQAYSYRDVLIVGGGYSFIFSNQQIQKSSDYWFTRINVETAGNSIALIDRLIKAPKKDSTYHILGQTYAQYIRTDFDIRYHYNFNEVSSIVYRGFLGVGLPYGNSRAIPFEKQYFGGGANSIRAWRVRSLGPGFYTDTAKFVNQTADIKMEFNAEYRFKLFWILEGALFMDAGNIWTYNYDPSRPGTQFSFREAKDPATGKIIKKPFYNEFALGTGTGLRFDLTFVIARVDLGIKLRDPARGWLIGNVPYTRKEFALELGIGYPF